MKKKMYKKGKFWVVASIATTSVLVGTSVAADEVVSSDADNSLASAVTSVNTDVTPSLSSMATLPSVVATQVESDSNTEGASIETQENSVASSQDTTNPEDSASNSQISNETSHSESLGANTAVVSTEAVAKPLTNNVEPKVEVVESGTSAFRSVPKPAESEKTSASVKIENLNNNTGTYDVIVTNVVTPNGLKRITVPTWTNKDGQDDILWNNAVRQSDGSYRLTVKASDHKGESGLYHSHVYLVESNDNFAWGGALEATLNLPKASAKVAIENLNNTTGSYDVVVTEVVAPRGLKRITVPTWTNKDGQDDILWNNAVRQSDGSYRLTVRASEHKGESGLYHSHVYLVEGDDNFAWGGALEATLNLPRTSARVAIENLNNTTGSYDVVITDVVAPRGLKRITVPTWTNKDGQDDILWNNAVRQSDGSYRLTVRASEHKGESGLYHSHVYLVEGDDNFAWGGALEATLNLPRTSAKVAIENVNNSARTYDVVITNVVTPRGLKRITVPTWSDKNGQDDILWKDAVRQADGSYRLTIKASDHNNEEGLYHSHVYLVESDDNFAWGGALETSFKFPRASAKVAIENLNNNTGSYDVVITNVTTPNGLKRITVPTWTNKDGQDDILWKDAVRQADGSYRLTVRASEHKGESGPYHSHVYLVESDDYFAWGGALEATLNLPKASAKVAIENVNNSTGTYDVVITNVVTPKGLKRITVPTWTEKMAKMTSSGRMLFDKRTVAIV